MKKSENKSKRLSKRLSKRHRKTFILTGVIIAVIEFLIIHAILFVELSSMKRDTYAYGRNVAINIELSLDNSINAAEFIRDLYLDYHSTLIEDFEIICEHFVRSNETISGLFIAPGGVVAEAYPNEIDDLVIGYNAFSDDRYKESVKHTVESGMTTISGPIELVEGGYGLLVRTPIYNENGKFLGFSAVTLEWNMMVEKIFENLNINDSMYHFTVWQKLIMENGENKDEIVFKSCHHEMKNLVVIPINLPNVEWYLTIEPTRGFISLKLTVILYLAGILGFLFVMYFVYYRMKTTEEYIDLVEYDSLTGLYTKHAFFRHAKELIESNQNKPIDILIADVENFKVINSLYGEEKGDEVLRYLGEKCRDNIGDGVCARFGNDQFVGIAVSSMERKTDWLTKFNNEIINGSPIPNLSLKYGIYENIDKTLSMALICDRALMAVKSIKHNYEVLYASYDGEISKQQIKTRIFESDFKEAIENKEFEVWYQPKFNTETEKMIGAEALVRWRKEGKWISPGEFIPIFESDGLISQLDEYVFSRVCETIKIWNEEGRKPIPISVNLSRASLHMSSVTKKYIDIVNEIGIASEYVPIELTESAMLQNVQVKEMSIGLKKEGFSLHMDDFGSGYSSLSSLNTLPFDVLKIDKSLTDLVEDDGGYEIIKHIIEIAHYKNISVVAEGVETKSQFDLLKSMKCDMIQGYYFSAPLPYDKFIEFAKDNV